MNIRMERPEDYFESETLTREAFWNVYRPGCLEHYVLHVLRRDPCFVPELTLVAEEDGHIVGQITAATGTLTRPNGEQTPLLLFGPLGVLPDQQGRGIGSALLTAALERAQAQGFHAAVLTGAPAYYRRFGFETATLRGLHYEGLDPAEECPFFMVRVLDETRAAELQGVYADPACYFADGAEVDAFDRAFPPKVKETRPGQLG